MEETPVILTKNTLVPIGVLGALLVVGTWAGKVEEKLEAHQLQLQNAPHALEKIEATSMQTSRDITEIKASIARIQGTLEALPRSRRGISP